MLNDRYGLRLLRVSNAALGLASRPSSPECVSAALLREEEDAVVVVVVE